MLEKDGFGGRRHLQAGEDMTEDRCSLPFGEKSGMFRFSQIHLFEISLVCDLTNTFVWEFANRMQDKAGGASCIGAENNPDNFEFRLYII